MKLFNNEGFFVVRVKNVSPKPSCLCLAVWVFNGFIATDKRFVNRLFSKTGGAFHILGLRFSSQIIYNSMSFKNAHAVRLLNKYNK